MHYQPLDWDTEFFGATVACITEPVLNEQELSKTLSELKTKGVDLAYWPSSQEIEGRIIRQFGGILADNKTTFFVDLRILDYEAFISTDSVEAFAKSMSISDIEDLAIQSGEYSRFAVDKRIPRERFVNLYKTWINRSLRKEIAEEVLVIREGERIAGMITLGNKNGRGDIGLIAVDREYRGKRYGEILVRASQSWFIRNGYQFGQVVTQGKNIAACNLYKKCGYSVEDLQYFYHFWL